jgi:hypothetical protein
MKRMTRTILVAIAVLVLFTSRAEAAFGYYKSLTLDASQSGSADSSNWPLTIALDGTVQAADADLKTVGNGGYVQNASGYDIRPYADSGLTTPLAFELVYYQATTGKLQMHVKVPTLSHTSSTVIYLAFGDSGISTDGSSTAAWNSNYKAVYHLEDGTTLSMVDSTGNSNATNGGADAATGRVQGGAAFIAANTDVIDTNLGGSALNISAGSIEWWQYNTNAAGSGVVESSWGTADPIPSVIISFQHYSDNNLYIGFYSTGNDTRIATAANSTNWPTATWVHLMFTWNTGGSSILYVNGTQQAINATNPVTADSGRALYLGVNGNYAGGYFGGSLDEWRLSNVDHSASWATADYNSQKASSTFITWGMLTSTGGGGGGSTCPKLSLLGVGC